MQSVWNKDMNLGEHQDSRHRRGTNMFEDNLSSLNETKSIYTVNLLCSTTSNNINLQSHHKTYSVLLSFPNDCNKIILKNECRTPALSLFASTKGKTVTGLHLVGRTFHHVCHVTLIDIIPGCSGSSGNQNNVTTCKICPNTEKQRE